MPSREPVQGSRYLHPQGHRGSASGHPRVNSPVPILGKPWPPGGLHPVGAKRTLGLCTGVLFCLPTRIGGFALCLALREVKGIRACLPASGHSPDVLG